MRRTLGWRPAGGVALFVLALGSSDTSATGWRTAPRREPVSACEGNRPELPQALFLDLSSGAFPGSGHPDAAVHVPPGFDATRYPGAVLYFHGWRSCVAAALGDEAVPCEEGGDARAASGMARQVDEAGVNALLIAVELRVDAPTGEPGQLAAPAGARGLVRETLERLREPLGCELDVEAMDRILVMAHSGGYQAAASVLALGDLPQISELVLLDALYGADDVFRSWVAGGVDQRRVVDLYTCCGGTIERSRALAVQAGRGAAILDDDGDGDLDVAALAHPFVFKRVPVPHGDLPRAYARMVLESAGFARIARR